MTDAVYFQHYQQALAGNLEGVKCVDPNHDIMHPFFDFDSEKVIFECLSCRCRVTPGLEMYERMSAELRKLPQPEPDNAEAS